MSGKLDLKSIVIAQLHYEELGRAFKELIKHIEPERFEFKLDEEGQFERPDDHDAFDDMKRHINVKDISTPLGDFSRKRVDAVLLMYPANLIPLLKCLQRQSVALQTLKGRVDRGQVSTKLIW